jgi:hypothetical protein
MAAEVRGETWHLVNLCFQMGEAKILQMPWGIIKGKDDPQS